MSTFPQDTMYVRVPFDNLGNWVSEAGIKGGASNYIPQIMCNVITCPGTWYLLVAHKTRFEEVWDEMVVPTCNSDIADYFPYFEIFVFVFLWTK